MKRETFDYIWGQIEKSILAIENQFDPDIKLKWNFRRAYGQEYCEIIKSEYETIRDQLKARCYKKAVDDEVDDNKVDQHKIAACFCYAFLQRKAFAFDLNDDIPAKMLLSNYMLAYSVSLQIIYLYMIDLYLSSADREKKELASVLEKKGHLSVPETTKTHDPYNLGRAKTLALNEYHNISFDLLAYADMMYWVEHYNRQCLEHDYIVEATNPSEMFQD